MLAYETGVKKDKTPKTTHFRISSVIKLGVCPGKRSFHGLKNALSPLTSDNFQSAFCAFYAISEGKRTVSKYVH